MWIQLRKAVRRLSMFLVVVCLLQIGATMYYVTTNSSRSWVLMEDRDAISMEWLMNASLSDLRGVIGRRIDPMGFFDAKPAAESASKIGKSRCDPPWSRPNGTFRLSPDSKPYFKAIGGNLTCLKDGTDFLRPLVNLSKCPCLRGWSGVSCSVPDTVRFSNYPFHAEGEPRVRAAPRRIIHAMPFNVEFEMLEAKFAEVGDVVDVFVLLESNYSAHGDPKPLRLLERLRAGYYADVACRIVHVLLDFFPTGAEADGWIADNIHRDYIASQGLGAQIKNYRLDDVFFLTDADELVSRESLLFLKLHDGWPEPVGFHMQRNTFGFFWSSSPRPVHVIGGVTVGVLTRVLNNRAIWIRTGPTRLAKLASEMRTYQKAYPMAQKINKLWSLGNSTHPAGFHCSWCCPAECVKIKLASAQNGDFPRWGDYVDKHNITYIKGIIQRGLWFDNESKLKRKNVTNSHYAPKHMMSNWEKYKNILVNPYRDTPLLLTDKYLAENMENKKLRALATKAQRPKQIQVQTAKKGNRTERGYSNSSHVIKV